MSNDDSLLKSDTVSLKRTKNYAVVQIERDLEIQTILCMSNVMAVKRLKYDDHDPLHARIASGSSLEIFDLLT